MDNSPRLFLTSMCGPDNAGNIIEMVDPLRQWLDGIIWVLHDCPILDAGSLWLESAKKQGLIIHRPWPRGRHFHSMNDTLYCGPMEEGDFFIWTDVLEHPRPEFVSRIKTDIIPALNRDNIDVVVYYGKPFLIRYRETLEYRGSPHWQLIGTNGRAIEWSQVEPDESKVRQNMRPVKRTDKMHWVTHYLKYMIEYPAGSNHALLGLSDFGDPNVLFPPREQNRLEFRREIKQRGYPVTVEGFKAMCKGPLDDTLVRYLNSDKVFSDAYNYLILGRTDVVHSHDPNKAIPVSLSV